MSAPEFSRIVRVDTLGPAPRRIAIAADEAERAALATRFGFVAIDRLEAETELALKNEAVIARGTIRAAVTQSCVASGEPVVETVEAPFAVEFRPHPKASGGEEEVELQGADLDIVFYDGAAVDIGETVAETLSLGVLPYPRAPGAEERLRAAGVRSEEEARPFGALAALRDKLSK